MLENNKKHGGKILYRYGLAIVFCFFLFSFGAGALEPAESADLPAQNSQTASETGDSAETENPAKPALPQEGKMDTVSADSSEDQPEIRGSLEPEPEVKALYDALFSTAYMPIDIMAGDHYLISDTDAFELMGAIYVPLRAMLRLVPGASLTWDANALRADAVFILQGTERKLSFYANSKLYKNNGKLLEMPLPTLQRSNAMMIPLSFLTELLNITAEYDPIYHVVALGSTEWVFDPNALAARFYSLAEAKDFARLIYKEAGGASYAAMHGVASVVLNHLRHPAYPFTLSGVIYAVAPSGVPHYTPAYKADFSSVIPNYSSVLASKWVLRGENSIGSCIFFNTRPFKNRTIYTKINGIYFCY